MCQSSHLTSKVSFDLNWRNKRTRNTDINVIQNIDVLCLDQNPRAVIYIAHWQLVHQSKRLQCRPTLQVALKSLVAIYQLCWYYKKWLFQNHAYHSDHTFKKNGINKQNHSDLNFHQFYSSEFLFLNWRSHHHRKYLHWGSFTNSKNKQTNIYNILFHIEYAEWIGEPINSSFLDSSK